MKKEFNTITEIIRIILLFIIAIVGLPFSCVGLMSGAFVTFFKMFLDMFKIRVFWFIAVLILSPVYLPCMAVSWFCQQTVKYLTALVDIVSPSQEPGG